MKKVMITAMLAIFVFGAFITTHGKTQFFQAIKDVFHYYSGDTQRPAVKETPARFEDTVKKQLRYPETEAETK